MSPGEWCATEDGKLRDNGATRQGLDTWQAMCQWQKTKLFWKLSPVGLPEIVAHGKLEMFDVQVVIPAAPMVAFDRAL